MNISESLIHLADMERASHQIRETIWQRIRPFALRKEYVHPGSDQKVFPEDYRNKEFRAIRWTLLTTEAAAEETGIVVVEVMLERNSSYDYDTDVCFILNIPAHLFYANDAYLNAWWVNVHREEDERVRVANDKSAAAKAEKERIRREAQEKKSRALYEKLKQQFEGKELSPIQHD
jgi:hypothetical protein